MMKCSRNSTDGEVVLMVKARISLLLTDKTFFFFPSGLLSAVISHQVAVFSYSSLSNRSSWYLTTYLLMVWASWKLSNWAPRFRLLPWENSKRRREEDPVSTSWKLFDFSLGLCNHNSAYNIFFITSAWVGEGSIDSGLQLNQGDSYYRRELILSGTFRSRNSEGSYVVFVMPLRKNVLSYFCEFTTTFMQII